MVGTSIALCREHRKGFSRNSPPLPWKEPAMLILSRKVGKRITIGEGIEIVVQRVAGERVTIGINAPSDIKILRGELIQEPTAGIEAKPEAVTEYAHEKLAPKVRHHDRTRSAAPALASQGLTNRVRGLKAAAVNR